MSTFFKVLLVILIILVIALYPSRKFKIRAANVSSGMNNF